MFITGIQPAVDGCMDCKAGREDRTVFPICNGHYRGMSGSSWFLLPVCDGSTSFLLTTAAQVKAERKGVRKWIVPQFGQFLVSSRNGKGLCSDAQGFVSYSGQKSCRWGQDCMQRWVAGLFQVPELVQWGPWLRAWQCQGENVPLAGAGLLSKITCLVIAVRSQLDGF